MKIEERFIVILHHLKILQTETALKDLPKIIELIKNADQNLKDDC